MQGFLQELAEQRWDDHRYYHHSRMNQSLHLLSAISFLFAYALLFVQPATAALVGWLIAMLTRQTGHFFFEPKGYDEANDATHEHKEAIKIGYNLRRKVVLLSVWAMMPLVVHVHPRLFGLTSPATDVRGFIENCAKLWIGVGVGAVVFRTVQLFFIMDVRTGLVWLTKILTDPFHDIKLYHRSPLCLLRGEWLDPMTGPAPAAAGHDEAA